MKIAISLTVLAAGLLLAAGDAPDVDVNQKFRGLQRELRVFELHKEWLATLKQLVDVATQSSKLGLASPVAVIEARQMLLNAQRDDAETNAERVKLQESIVKLLMEKEKLSTETIVITGRMQSMQWLILLSVSILFGVLVGVAVSVKRLAKSWERDSSKIQALLAEIKANRGQ